MLGNVFISYSRKDLPKVQQIVHGLEHNHHSVFLDVAEIMPGQNWFEALKKGIEQSDTFLFVLSPNSLSSELLMTELNTAVAAGKRIIPIIIDDVDSDKIPPVLKEYQWLDLRHGHGHVTDRLKAFLGTGRNVAPEPSIPKSKGYVFLSYAEGDGEFVQDLRTFLKEKGYAYWDYEESDRDYHNQLFLELENVILESAAVFAVISENWKKSKWTVREFFFAEESKRPVFLLRAKPVGPTLAIAGIPYIDFVGDFQQGLSKLDRELTRKGL